MLSQVSLRHFAQALEFSFRDKQAVHTILRSCLGDRAVIQLLKMAQSENAGHLTYAALQTVARLTDTPLTQVTAAAQSSPMFKYRRLGRHRIECCNGTSCFVNRKNMHAVIERATGGDFKTGISPDGLFELADGQCQGKCANAPWMRVDGVEVTKLTEEEIVEIIGKIKKDEQQP